jgi:uncharacterized protein (TIGR00288 family)
MTDKKIAFLVDFDNVATDVIEQALNAVFKDYGAAHIRRAYCNAEQALREQSFLKRLGLRAIVNLAIGKNSTDIALAVDAMDLAITEKPDVIVLVSSDSDFAPLVLRLREKGAWLRGFGQYGKTGDGVIQIYDQFNELAHGIGRSGRDAPAAKAGSNRGGRRGRGGRALPEVPRGNGPQRPPRAETVAALPEPVVAEVVEVVEPVDVAEPVTAAPAPAAKSPKAPKAAAKTSRKTAAKAPADAPAEAAPAPKAAAPVKPPKPADKAPAAKAPPAAEDPQVAAAKEINAILALLPKLADGQWHELGAAVKVLKDAGLLAKNAPSTKLFRKHPKAFELQPDKTPNRVRFGHG